MRRVLHIAPDHPTAPGHFPGNPIIPGAWLLAAVVREVAAGEGWAGSGISIKMVKFLKPVRPGDTLEVEYELVSSGGVKFDCLLDGVKVMSGVVSADEG